jgi:D-xylose transport system permease protein
MPAGRLLLAIIVAVVVGAAVGALYALLYNRLGMPSFVATLAGLLALLGLQLYILGPTGSINLPYGSPLVELRPDSRHAGLAVACAGAGAGCGDDSSSGMRTRERRRAANLSSQPFGASWPCGRHPHRGSGICRLLSQPRPRRAVDVRLFWWCWSVR